MPNRRQKRTWYPEELVYRLQAPNHLIPWLLTTQSLTQKIRQTCPQMQVKVLSERWERPLAQEAQQLNLPLLQKAWVRCVLLQCDQADWVYARTVIPNCLAGNPWFALKQLGNRPLGEVLFQRPAKQRTPFRLQSYSAKHWPYLLTHLNENSYARQSTFEQAGAKLLLTEVFFVHSMLQPKEIQ